MTPSTASATLDLGLWADLSKSGKIAKLFAGDRDAALAAARTALSYRNVVVRRNGVRLVEAAFKAEAPLKRGHPAVKLLDGVGGDARPLLMWESMAAMRRLMGHEPDDLSVSEPGLFKPAPDPKDIVLSVPKEGAGSSTGQRVACWVARRRAPERGFHGRRFWTLPLGERTPAEVEYGWAEVAASAIRAVAFADLNADCLSEGPRATGHKTVTGYFANEKPRVVRHGLSHAWFFEDPLLVDAVAPLLKAALGPVRRKAIVVAGASGSEAVLNEASRARAEGEWDLQAALWGLALLGDIRGFKIIREFASEGVLLPSALRALAVFGELSGLAPDLLRANPHLLGEPGARTILCVTHPGREAEAALAVAAGTTARGGERAALASLALRSTDVPLAATDSPRARRMRFCPDGSGRWNRDPSARPLSTDAAALLSSSWWWQDLDRANRLVSLERPALLPDATRCDLATAVLCELADRVRDRGKTTGERASALRWAATVAGPLADRVVAKTLEGLAPAEGEALRSAASVSALTPPKARPYLDLRTWSDLSKSGELSSRLAANPQEALDAARTAFTYRNVVFRRNAVRVVEAAYRPSAPLDETHPALALLESAWGDERPLVMWEAVAAWRRLRGLPPNDLTATIPGIPAGERGYDFLVESCYLDPEGAGRMRGRASDEDSEEYWAEKNWKRDDADPRARELSEAELDTGLGRKALKRARAEASRRWDWDGPRRGWAAIDGPEDAPAYAWNVREGFSGMPAASFGGYAHLNGPRGEVLEALRKGLHSKNRKAFEAAISGARFLEDPLLADALRPLLTSPNKIFRRLAIGALGVIGDESVIEVAQQALAAKDQDLVSAIWALAHLGDVRGFDLAIRMAQSKTRAGAVMEALGGYGELAGLAWLSLQSSLLAEEGTLRWLKQVRPGREVDALLEIADAAAKGDAPSPAFKAMRPQASTAWIYGNRAGNLAAAGFVRNAEGQFRRASERGRITPEEAAEFQKYQDSRWVGEQNVRVKTRSLTPKAQIYETHQEHGAWYPAVLLRLCERVADPATPMGTKLRALREIAVLAPEENAFWAGKALAPLPLAEAEALRAGLTKAPSKKGGKAK